ncbi:MAG: tetratricopeptide repeat protein [Planctomycetes bacterium]|nr:tetratricopeptide repeat protein [Planctomycetota bacterium]
MPIDVAVLFTAQELSVKDVFHLKYASAADENLKKELGVFNREYENAQKVIPKDERSLRKGILCYLTGDFHEALVHLESSNNPTGNLLKVIILHSLSKSADSKKSLKALLAQTGKEKNPWLSLLGANSACDLRDAESAKKILADADIKKTGASGQFVLSRIQELEGDYQSALDGYEKAASEEHDLRGLALFHFAKLLDMRGHDQEALENYKQIETLGYQFEEALVNMGVLLEDKKEYTAAIKCYERALKINPENTKAKLYHADAEACLDMHYDERKLQQDIKTNEILAIPISDFELSVRSRNCLSKMGIYTLRDLITKTEEELLTYKNFGDTSLKEIRAMLTKKGVHLGMTRVDEQPLADRIRMNTQVYSFDRNYELDQLDTPIEELNLSYRTKSTLHKLSFESLRDITMRTGADLENNPSISPACLQEINALLEERGLSYRPATSSGKPDDSMSGNILLDGPDEDGAAATDYGIDSVDSDDPYDDE